MTKLKTTLAVLLATATVLIWLGCEPPGRARAAPPPDGVEGFELRAQAADSFQVAALWPPVVFQGDTIRSFHRHSTRTDTSGYVQTDTISAVGSETLVIPSPRPGATGEYSYCLRSQNDFGLSADSACAFYTYTNPDTLPPPPDSVTVEPPVAVTFDSVRIFAVGDSTSLDTLRLEVGEVAEVAAALYRDGRVVGCAGAPCDSIPIYPAAWVKRAPYYVAQREGYPLGQEWVAKRLPWLRRLGG